MSKKNFSELTMDERAELARQVKPLRQKQGMTQKALGFDAGVTRATINNLERGITPQAETLQRVLGVLGVETESIEFDEQTEIWLSIMGNLIEAIPLTRRQKHVDTAIGDLAAGIHDTDQYENVSILPTNVGGDREDEALRHKAVASDMEDGGIGE